MMKACGAAAVLLALALKLVQLIEVDVFIFCARRRVDMLLIRRTF